MAIGVKTGGRKKGSVNKRTAAQRSRAEIILALIDEKYFEKDIKKLSSSQRMILYASMMEYVAPKLSRTTLAGNVKNEMIVRIKRDRT